MQECPPPPTGQPTSQPSAQPSRQPSGQPSSQPSAQPSQQPSGRPSSQPTSQPTGQPTKQPTSMPSARPTLASNLDMSGLEAFCNALQCTSNSKFKQIGSFKAWDFTLTSNGEYVHSPCTETWYGVSCITVSVPMGGNAGKLLEEKRVSSINIVNANVAGTLAPQLAQLTYLSTLDVSFNSITGTIPSSYESFSYMTSMSFDNNKLTGGIHLCGLVTTINFLDVQLSGCNCYDMCWLPSLNTKLKADSSMTICNPPTGQPTGRPTGQPSGRPTGQPSHRPSGQPSRRPTGQPSLQPTSRPTSTYAPSWSPSASPGGVTTSTLQSTNSGKGGAIAGYVIGAIILIALAYYGYRKYSLLSKTNGNNSSTNGGRPSIGDFDVDVFGNNMGKGSASVGRSGNVAPPAPTAPSDVKHTDIIPAQNADRGREPSFFKRATSEIGKTLGLYKASTAAGSDSGAGNNNTTNSNNDGLGFGLDESAESSRQSRATSFTAPGMQAGSTVNPIIAQANSASSSASIVEGTAVPTIKTLRRNTVMGRKASGVGFGGATAEGSIASPVHVGDTSAVSSNVKATAPTKLNTTVIPTVTEAVPEKIASNKSQEVAGIRSSTATATVDSRPHARLRRLTSFGPVGNAKTSVSNPSASTNNLLATTSSSRQSTSSSDAESRGGRLTPATSALSSASTADCDLPEPLEFL